MIELRRDDILEELEEKEFEAIDREDDNMEISELCSTRFERIAAQARAAEDERHGSHSTDSLYLYYYRSLGKIPPLTREQEIYLAKKLESARLNALR
jgi:hypothetical protein